MMMIKYNNLGSWVLNFNG